jgi:hypothetical protein
MNSDLNMHAYCPSALCILAPHCQRPPNCSGAGRSRCTRKPAQKNPIGDVTEVRAQEAVIF